MFGCYGHEPSLKEPKPVVHEMATSPQPKANTLDQCAENIKFAGPSKSRPWDDYRTELIRCVTPEGRRRRKLWRKLCIEMML